MRGGEHFRDVYPPCHECEFCVYVFGFCMYVFVALDWISWRQRVGRAWDMGHIMFVGVFLCAVSMAADGGVNLDVYIKDSVR